MEKLTITVSELAEAMGISKPTAYELASRKDFPCIQLGRRRIIPVESFKNWLEAQANGQTGANHD